MRGDGWAWVVVVWEESGRQLEESLGAKMSSSRSKVTCTQPTRSQNTVNTDAPPKLNTWGDCLR